ncbi:MAG: DNA polymerase III subunit delta [Candidatus Omnitrophota bacterium]
MNYLIIGDDEYLREREEIKIREKFLSTDQIDLNYSVYQPQETDNIMDSLNTVPFMGDRRVVLVKDAHQLSPEALGAIVSYMEKPDQANVLVLSAAGPLGDSKSYKKLSSLVETIKADKPDLATMKKWIKSFFKKENIDISREAVDLIVELKGQDSSGIKTELEKLASYSGGKKIEVSHVEELVGRSVTETVFKLVDAINAKDSKWAFRVLSDLYDQKKQPHEIIGYLGWYFKVIQKIIFLSSKKTGINAIASEIGYSPGYVRRLSEQSKKYSAEKISRWISLLLDTDRDIKTGRKDAVLALETLVTTFLYF